MRAIVLLLSCLAFAIAYIPNGRVFLSAKRMAHLASKITITEGVDFDTIAREWRLKWSAGDEKSSLAAVQKKLDSVVGDIKQVDGVKSVQRIVCGGCLDYKVVVALSADKFGAWEQKKFFPEEKFITEVTAIPGVTAVETQTYTLMPAL